MNKISMTEGALMRKRGKIGPLLKFLVMLRINSSFSELFNGGIFPEDAADHIFQSSMW